MLPLPASYRRRRFRFPRIRTFIIGGLFLIYLIYWTSRHSNGVVEATLPKTPRELKALPETVLKRLIPNGCPKPPWSRNLTSDPVLIVGHWYSHDNAKLGSCPTPCRFERIDTLEPKDIRQKSLLRTADARFFSITNVDIEPAHIDDSTGRRECPLQQFVLYSQESEDWFPMVRESKNYGFNVSMDYRLDSDVPVPYLHNDYLFLRPPVPVQQKHQNVPISAFISNCVPRNNRHTVHGELMKLLKIDSYGQCWNNKKLEFEPGTSMNEQKMNAIKNYKFNLVFENSNAHDYVSEKLFQPLEAGTVPIFLGTSDVNKFIPDPKSIINLSQFKSLTDLADYIHYLDANDAAYLEFLAWKKRPLRPEFQQLILKYSKYSAQCRLCMYLAGRDWDAEWEQL